MIKCITPGAQVSQNNPYVFVMISAAVYQNDGLACASFGGFPALCWVACSLEQRVRGGSVVD